MAAHRILSGAVLASLALGSQAHAIDARANDLLQARHCSPTKTETVTCTVLEKEIVTVREYFTVTASGATCNVTASHSATTLPPSSVLTTSTVLPPTTSAANNLTVTPTVTPTFTNSTTVPSTPTASVCPPPPSCDNLGFDWAYYPNPARNGDKTYSLFHPAAFKRQTPRYTSTSLRVGGTYPASADGGRTGPIYGAPRDFQLDFFALNHHAYIYACEAGTYRVDIPYANDAVDVWIGAKAYSGWTEANADAQARYNQPDHIAGSAHFNFTIPADTYVPIRFVYGQAQYGGGFYFNVTAPSGQVIVSDKDSSNPYVVRQSCDGVTAPAYPAFGREI